MTKNIMNVGNNNNLRGNYPVFLGEDLGFADTVNVTYPDIEQMYLDQRAQYWVESEINLDQDRKDLKVAPDSEKDVMILNLLAQHLLDSVASRGILETFSPFITNTEVHSLLSWQSMMEGIHARSYSHIFRNCFVSGNEVLERGKHNVMVQYRTGIIGEVFNQTNQMGAKYLQGEHIPMSDLKKQLLKNMAVLYGLEAISFMGSFACTFALVETGRYQGIGKLVGLICSDEILHAEGDRMIFDAMLNKEDYQGEMEEVKDDIQAIFDKIVEQELKWAEYIFSEGRKVLGLNVELLKEYVYHIAKPCYDYLGLDWKDNPVITNNPLAYMDKYIDRNMVQSAAQEIQLNSYLVGAVDSSGGDEIYDF